MIWYEIEYFSFLIIAVLFSAGNAKKNVFTVFIDPIVTIDGFIAGFKIRTFINIIIYIPSPPTSMNNSSISSLGTEIDEVQ